MNKDPMGFYDNQRYCNISKYEQCEKSAEEKLNSIDHKIGRIYAIPCIEVNNNNLNRYAGNGTESRRNFYESIKSKSSPQSVVGYRSDNDQNFNNLYAPTPFSYSKVRSNGELKNIQQKIYTKGADGKFFNRQHHFSKHYSRISRSSPNLSHVRTLPISRYSNNSINTDCSQRNIRSPVVCSTLDSRRERIYSSSSSSTESFYSSLDEDKNLHENRAQPQHQVRNGNDNLMQLPGIRKCPHCDEIGPGTPLTRSFGRRTTTANREVTMSDNDTIHRPVFGYTPPCSSLVKMRRDGDMTILTEHRSPYSFYWHLEKDAPKTNELDANAKYDQFDKEITGENVIEEFVPDENAQTFVGKSIETDHHSSRCERVDAILSPRSVKRMANRFAPVASLECRSPRRRLLGAVDSHEDPSKFSHYWRINHDDVASDIPGGPMKGTTHRILTTENAEAPRMMIPSPGRDRESIYYVQKIRTSKPFRAQVVDKVVQSAMPSLSTKDQSTSATVKPPTMAQQQRAQSLQHQQQPVIVEKGFKQTTTKRKVENDFDSSESDEIFDNIALPVRFAARSVGCTEIPEQELTPDKSSRAVNTAIVRLSEDNIRNNDQSRDSRSIKWGDGKEIIMELDKNYLRLMDPDTGTILHLQPIHQIRVWGVGRDNGRDFAYVARDKSTRRFVCYVFRCDTPARVIANSLRDICRMLMNDRNNDKTTVTNGGARVSSLSDQSSSPATLPGQPPVTADEPKKILRCHFLGVTQVPKATGIEILNEAVDRLVAQVQFERWILCDVTITPTVIRVCEVSGNQIVECKVRYLSFLGIGRDIKHCAFIMQKSSDNFMCYVFHIEPSAGPMAKSIEAACKLRYQKAVESNNQQTPSDNQQYRGWGSTLRDVIGSFTNRRTPDTDTKRYSR